MSDGLNMSAAPAKKQTHLSEMETVIREKIAEGGSVTFSPKGTSMLPMLRTSGDRVTLVKPPARLKKGKVALFVYDGEEGRKYVLHRLVAVKDGKLIFCGDNRVTHDEPVEYDDVIGVVSGYESRGRSYTERELWYRLYRRWMVLTRGFRRPALAVQNRIYRLWKKLKG